MIPNCPHCGERLEEVYIHRTEYENYLVSEGDSGIVAKWHCTDAKEDLSGPYCAVCGRCVEVALID